MNVLKLKAKMAEREITTVFLAEELGIARSTLWRKMCSGNFTVGEAEKIISVLQLSYDEVGEIFFPNYRTNATKEFV